MRAGISNVKYAAIGPIALHFPAAFETNDDLQAQFPSWDMELIFSKTGIWKRHIAGPGECASDLGVAAAEKLFQQHRIDRESIDFLLFCTQTPDYPLPTTACLMQSRLGLSPSVGALDFNLGCSAYVYGLSIADGLIRSGAANRVLFITAETYSKYIHPDDRSLRTIFGDGAAATLVEAADQPSLTGFTFGTDGSGADMLFAKGGARPSDAILKPRSRWRWASELYMDGPGLIDFTLEAIPSLISRVISTAGWQRESIDYFILHQATKRMLDLLRERMGVEETKVPLELKDFGNTVSSTIPIVIHQLRHADRLPPGTRSLLVGFGVGLSWAGCSWKVPE